ncbi:hypothetical protein [Fimbriiglobus ruber]|uniref:Uncharacterized protein n=1 Tax=Fimbriiglobus ruber TaxID=1908690 RepID=A0A225DQD4_9BACT|nr:hypothetical protein [Fimbriiglobus ruber]OWK39756.1 hypothetical protein FRUB_05646 [Fimbriiglobus ruber]
MKLLLDLLLLAGRAEDARTLLDRAELRRNPDGLGLYDLPATDGTRRWAYRFQAYDWFDLCQSAGVGAYDRAADALARLDDRFRREEAGVRAAVIPGLTWRLAAEAGLGAAPAAVPAATYVRIGREQFVGLAVQRAVLDVERADLCVVGSTLLLEQGRAEAAAAPLGRAADLYPRAAAAPARPGWPLAVRLLAATR